MTAAGESAVCVSIGGGAAASKARGALIGTAGTGDIAPTEGVVIAERLREEGKAEKFIFHTMIPANYEP